MPEAAPLPNRDALDACFRADPYAAGLGASLDDWGPGWARVRWTPTPAHHNFVGGVHGGALFSVADVALSVASNSWGRKAVALSVEVQLLASPRAGTALVAECRERSRTRRTGAYLIEVVDPDGRLVASAQAMAYRTGGWHLGEDAWSAEWRAAH